MKIDHFPLNLRMLITLLLAVAITLPCLASAENREKPILMAALGDSLTAATLANAPLRRTAPDMYIWPPIDFKGFIKEWLDQQYSDGYIVANKDSLSWVSGKKISSHFRLLQDYLKSTGEIAPLEVLNFAFPRDTIQDLDNQVRQLIKATQSGKYFYLKYITLMIGSNDVCNSKNPQGPPLAIMREHLKLTFKKLSEIKQDEPIRILMVGIPPITELGLPSIRKTAHPFGKDCEYIRQDVLHFCDTLLTWNTPEEKRKKDEIIQESNRLLLEVTEEASSQYSNLQIYFTQSLQHISIKPEILALDCFHLDQNGQAQLATELWNEQPWFSRSR